MGKNESERLREEYLATIKGNGTWTRCEVTTSVTVRGASGRDVEIRAARAAIAMMQAEDAPHHIECKKIICFECHSEPATEYDDGPHGPDCSQLGDLVNHARPADLLCSSCMAHREHIRNTKELHGTHHARALEAQWWINHMFRFHDEGGMPLRTGNAVAESFRDHGAYFMTMPSKAVVRRGD